MTVLALDRYAVAPDSEKRFRELIDELLIRMRVAGGILWADAAKASDDEPSYVVLSEWRSDADLEAWETDDPAAVFRDGVDVLLRGEVVRRRFVNA